MKRIFNALFGSKPKPRRKMRRPAGYRPGVENLEDRRLMAADFQFQDSVLSITGGEYRDVARVEVANNQVTAKIWSAKNATVSINADSLPAQQDTASIDFNQWTGSVSSVWQVKFNGLGGNDHFRNLTEKTAYAYGGIGNDTLQGGPGYDVLDGGIGDDTYVFVGSQTGGDMVSDGSGLFYSPGGGVDTLDFSGMSRAIKVDLQATTGAQSIDPSLAPGIFIPALSIQLNGVTTNYKLGGEMTYASVIENVKGSAYNDFLRGNSSPNRLEGNDGADVLEGRGGDDTLLGGVKNDTYVFGSDASGHDTVTETTGAGVDTLDFQNYGEGVSIDLNNQVQSISNGFYVTLQTPAEMENVVGTSSFDWLLGNAKANRLEGRGDNDTLEGRGGDDVLAGGSGDDFYMWRYGGNYGHDTIEEAANTGRDTLDFHDTNIAVGVPQDAPIEVADAWWDVRPFDLSLTTRQTVLVGHLDLTLSSSTGIEDVRGTELNDYIFGNSRSNEFEGFGGADVMWGAGGDDDLYGGDGDDDLRGMDGSDSLYGQGDDDWLSGGDNGDWLFGGDGEDVLLGGQGADFLFGEWDDDELYGSSFYDDDGVTDYLDGGSGWDFHREHAWWFWWG